MLDVRFAYEAVNIREPRPFQETAWQRIAKGANTLISAGTGSGKTEAAFLPALVTGRRIIALYPTKALLQDQLPRIQQLAGSKAMIAVDTGDEDDNAFYRADCVLTSVDKFLYRFFGYGKKRWSYLYPYRIAFDHTRETVLILDEAHAYEDIAFSHLWFLLKKLTYERSVQTVLLSATLPSALIEALEDVEHRYFPRALNEGPFFQKVTDAESRSGTLIYAGQISTEEIVAKTLDAFDRGKRVIVVLDAVVRPADSKHAKGRTLHEIWQRLVQEIGSRPFDKFPQALVARTDDDEVKGNILAYHGHQMPSYRTRVLRCLKNLDDRWKVDGSGRTRQAEPFILVTTSAMEVGVDVSSDVMITDLCGCDSFVQRIGRCARRPGEAGEVYLIADDDRQVNHSSRLLWDQFQDRRHGSSIDAELKQQLNAHNTMPDLSRIHLRLEYVQDQSLYRYVYDFVQENRELWEKGVLITREWEPSIALVRSETRNGHDYIGGIPARDFWCAKDITEKLLLPISAAASIAPYCAWCLEAYDAGNQFAQRLVVGGVKQRTLRDALELAGVRAQPQTTGDANKVRAVYGIGLPLIFLLPSHAPLIERLFPSEAEGVVYRKLPNQWATKTSTDTARWPGYTRSPSKSLLDTFGVLLQKPSGAIELPVYWFEPNSDNEP